MKTSEKIRYAVVGLGHIAQAAVLPAFKNSTNSELAALVSGDAEKRKALGKKYNVEKVFSYKEFDRCLKGGDIDAVYIALPNHLHKDCAVRVAEAGLHILCEKPLAVTAHDAEAMIFAAKYNGVKLMTAYRLHFDPTNLRAIDLVQSGRLGQPLFFISEFGHQVKESNIRADPDEGGTPLHDLGVYCINAARYLFRAEPIEVSAEAFNPTPRLKSIDQTIIATMRFAQERAATFICSFASAEVSNLRVIGTEGDLYIENPYEYTGETTECLTLKGKTKTATTKIGDQFAAELSYFSDCVLQNREPEPSGQEGLIDVQIIEALEASLSRGESVGVSTAHPTKRPSSQQEIKKPAHALVPLVHAESEAIGRFHH